MKNVELTKASGEIVQYPLNQVLSIGSIGQVVELKLIGRDLVYITWIQGRCERMLEKPSKLDKFLVKIAASDLSEGNYVVPCVKAALE